MSRSFLSSATVQPPNSRTILRATVVMHRQKPGDCASMDAPFQERVKGVAASFRTCRCTSASQETCRHGLSLRPAHEAHAADLHRSEFRTHLEDRALGLDLSSALHLSVVLELDPVALDDDLELVPLVFLQ